MGSSCVCVYIGERNSPCLSNLSNLSHVSAFDPMKHELIPWNWYTIWPIQRNWRHYHCTAKDVVYHKHHHSQPKLTQHQQHCPSKQPQSNATTEQYNHKSLKQHPKSSKYKIQHWHTCPSFTVTSQQLHLPPGLLQSNEQLEQSRMRDIHVRRVWRMAWQRVLLL